MLYDLRKRFRLACTDGLGISDMYIPQFNGVETPLVDAYLTLTASTFSLREYRIITTLSMDDSMKENSGLAKTEFESGFQDIMDMLKTTKYLATVIPQYSLSTRIAQRAKIFNDRYRRCMSRLLSDNCTYRLTYIADLSCMKYIVRIRSAFDAAIQSSFGPDNKPQFSFDEVGLYCCNTLQSRRLIFLTEKLHCFEGRSP